MVKQLDSSCKQNLDMIQEINEVFNFKRMDTETTHKKVKELIYHDPLGIVRKARQIVTAIIVGAVSVVTSLISIFINTQLLYMAQSDDTEDDVIDNNNHIITSIQNHEIRILRQEMESKELISHIDFLEEVVIEQRKLDALFRSLFAVSTFFNKHNKTSFPEKGWIL